MPTPRPLRVFLCHASQDKPVVRALYQKLAAEPWIDPWLDEERLLPGQDWNLEIEKAVESSDAVIVCVSSISVAKEGYVQRELRQVLSIALEKLEGAIFVIPLRLDDCPLPRQLKDRQSLDYFPASQQTAAFNKLKRSLAIRKDSLGI
jgi:TIR domain-containing protein